MNSWYKKYIVSFRNPLDIFTKKITDSIFKKIKNGENVFEIDFISELSILNIEISKIHVISEEKSLPNNNFIIKGDFDKDTKELIIEIKIDKSKFSQELYNNFLETLYGATRHELEHAYYQDNHPYHSPSYDVEESSEDLDIETRIRMSAEYLRDLSEIDAIIRQIMLMAKFRKTVFLEDLQNEIWRILYSRNGMSYSYAEIERMDHRGNPRARNILILYDQILRIYQERSLIIYPEAFK